MRLTYVNILLDILKSTMENGTHGRLYVHPAAAGEVFPFPGLINGGTQKLFISWNFLLKWMI